jgi:hypothetical protein
VRAVYNYAQFWRRTVSATDVKEYDRIAAKNMTAAIIA